MGNLLIRGAVVVAATVATVAVPAAQAATPPPAHGHLLHVPANAKQSKNWFGYSQGSLEQGGKPFHSISGDWTVPTATQHSAGQAESSAAWIGIGGSCVDANCSKPDNTLIQAGTEQDVSASGAASYGAWWEIIPNPSVPISSLAVRPGDHMHADITEVAPNSNVWKITLSDATRGQTFTTTVPYKSTHATAEWVEETPLIAGAGLAGLPDLSNPAFTAARTNSADAALKAAEQMHLIDANGTVIGAPSAPSATGDGFSDCAWASSC
jgi:hypothetical protein